MHASRETATESDTWLMKNLFQEQCLGRGRGRNLMGMGEERMDV